MPSFWSSDAGSGDVLLDQLFWRPLIAWTDKFKVEMVEATSRRSHGS
jgi:hypothetical protein